MKTNYIGSEAYPLGRAVSRLKEYQREHSRTRTVADRKKLYNAIQKYYRQNLSNNRVQLDANDVLALNSYFKSKNLRFAPTETQAARAAVFAEYTALLETIAEELPD